ncbi:MAG: sulfotransferase domain-containing protein [Nitrospinae bacterium]|nr:sulfotransferase domain-containing protein [Nitrospinota bacterium]
MRIINKLKELREQLQTVATQERKRKTTVIKKWLKNQKKIALYGTGEHTHILLREIPQLIPMYIVDKKGSTLESAFGVEVVSVCDIKEEPPEILLISSMTFEKEIKEELYKEGIDKVTKIETIYDDSLALLEQKIQNWEFLNAEVEEQLWVEKRAEKIPTIFFNSSPKSGSTYLAMSLSEELNLPYKRISLYGVFKDKIVPEWLERCQYGGCVIRDHLKATPYHLNQLMRCNINRIILTIRDPRQALLSFAWFIEEKSIWDQVINKASPEAFCPDGFNMWGISDRIDCLIENYLPQLIVWIEEWLEIEKNGYGSIKILLVEFKEIKEDPLNVTKRILEFYSLDPYKAQSLPKPTKEKLYRKGELNEWLDTFTDEQRKRATQCIPNYLLKRFNWHK